MILVRGDIRKGVCEMAENVLLESILTSIKKLLGIAEEYEHFDSDLIMHINSVFSILTQLGVGPEKGFMVTDKSAVWEDFIPSAVKLQMVKSYMHLRVKLLFDPPLGSAVIEAMNRQISELEWRIEVEADSEGGNTTEYDSQTLDTINKVLNADIVVSEVPYYETANETGSVTSYIAREGNSK
jgi:hypothetical protein|nr:MAG TPA: hypothetical protein [Caudoviricetes sp.]